MFAQIHTMPLQITLPKSHDAITIGQVMRYNKVNGNPIDVCKTFCKGDVDQVTYDEAMAIAETIVDLMNMGEPIFKPFIDIGGVQYGFHPDLNGMLVGEFIDMEAFCADPSNNAHKFMSVIYRPVKRRVGNRYEIQPYQPDSIEYHPDAFLDVPFSVYRGALAFFLTLAAEFESNLSSFSRNKIKQLTTTSENEQSLML